MNTFFYDVARFLPERLLCKSPRSIPYILPYYHAISNEVLPHIQPLYQVRNVKAFESDLDYLLSQFTPISIGDLMSHVNSGTTLPKRWMLLSFDDGLREFYDVASPILLSKGVPAINFVNPNFINNTQLFYRYKVALSLTATNGATPATLQHISKLLSLSNQSLASIKAKINTLSHINLVLIDQILEVLAIDVDKFLVDQKPYLNTDQIKTLLHQGFDIGAHSMDHPNYQTLSEEMQIKQTIDSCSWVKSTFDLQKVSFSFPFTDYNIKSTFFAAIKDEVAVTFGGAGVKKDNTPRHYQRVPMEIGQYKATDIVRGEYLYFWAKTISGHNTIKRS